MAEEFTPLAVLEAMHGITDPDFSALTVNSVRDQIARSYDHLKAMSEWALMVEACDRAETLLDQPISVKNLSDQDLMLLLEHPTEQIGDDAIKHLSDPALIVSLLRRTYLSKTRMSAITSNPTANADILQAVWEREDIDDSARSRVLGHAGITTAEAFSIMSSRPTSKPSQWQVSFINALAARIKVNPKDPMSLDVVMRLASALSHPNQPGTQVTAGITSVVTKSIPDLSDDDLIRLCSADASLIRNEALYALASRNADMTAAVSAYATKTLHPIAKNVAVLHAHPHIITLDLLANQPYSPVVRDLRIIHPDASFDDVKNAISRMAPDDRLSLVNAHASRSVNVVRATWRDRSIRVKQDSRDAGMRYYSDVFWNLLTVDQRVQSFSSATFPQIVANLAVGDLDDRPYVRAIAASLRNPKLDGKQIAHMMSLLQASIAGEDYVTDLVARFVVPTAANRANSASLFAALLQYPDPRVRIALAESRNLPVEVSVALAGDENDEVRETMSATLVSAALG